MKRRAPRIIFGIVTLAVLAILSLSPAAYAQRGKAKTEETVSAIPKDKRTWAGLPWLIGSALGAATIAVGCKNSRRSHLD
ncbi:MAG: hypothetical protein JW810_05035 [Sedimentisphaerales bacterium]|nr:hypothetical protein [Sedimentisphaerales bacterium]